jgi:hypothetical protein
LTDDESADFKPNCYVDNDGMGGTSFGSQTGATGLVPTAAMVPNLGTADFSLEMWMCEQTPLAYYNYGAWSVLTGYMDPPYAVNDRPDAFTRITPQIRFVWNAGAPGFVTNIWVGLGFHTADFGLFYWEDDSNLGTQGFWGTQIARLPVGEWVHVAIVVERSNNEVRLYLNGTLTDTLNIAGHAAYNVLDRVDTAPHVVPRSLTNNYLIAPDRGVAGRLAWSFPHTKWNLWTVHYEALTAAQVKQSYLGRTTQNRATTYIRYDWRDTKLGSYSLSAGHVRWKLHYYFVDAATWALDPDISADTYFDYRIGTRGLEGTRVPWMCKEIRDLLAGHVSSTCCDSSLWGASQGHAHITLAGWGNGFDQDPFWES